MKIKHPTIPGIVRDVLDADEWLAMGWLPVDDQPEPPGAGEAAPRRRTKKTSPATE